MNCTVTGTIELLMIEPRFNRDYSFNNYMAGGLVGSINGGLIDGCRSECDINICSPRGFYTGGFVGRSVDAGKIINCGSTGNVKCDSYGSVKNKGDYDDDDFYVSSFYVGAFSGYNFNYLTNSWCITNCYATGDVMANINSEAYIGGFSGDAWQLNNCYWSGSLSVTTQMAEDVTIFETSEKYNRCIYFINADARYIVNGRKVDLTEGFPELIPNNEMKSDGFAARLRDWAAANTGSLSELSNWSVDKLNANNGYPVFGQKAKYHSQRSEYEFKIFYEDNVGNYTLRTDGKYIYGYTNASSNSYNYYVASMVLDRKGKSVLSEKKGYAFARGQSMFSEGLLCVSDDYYFPEKYGYINEKGEVAVDLIYEFAESFSYGLGVVKKNGKYGCIDKNGSVVVDFIYDWIDRYKNGHAMAVIDGEYLVALDTNGAELKRNRIEKYGYMSPFVNGLAFVRRDSVTHEDSYEHIVDLNGLVSYKASDTIATITKLSNAEEGYSFINEDGDIICDYILEARVDNDDHYLGHGASRTTVFFAAGFFTDEGVSLVKIDGKYALINKNGGVVNNNLSEEEIARYGKIPPEYAAEEQNPTFLYKTNEDESREEYFDANGDLIYYNNLYNHHAYDALGNDIFPFEIHLIRLTDTVDDMYVFSRSDLGSYHAGFMTINKLSPF